MTMIETFLLACKANGVNPVSAAEAVLRMSEEEIAAAGREEKACAFVPKFKRDEARVKAELRKLPRKRV